MPYVDANGVRTYYEEHGGGPPVMLLHGAAMVAEAWQPQVNALSKHFTVYVPERRGVGRTPDNDGPWTYFGMARDMAAFMDALQIGRADLVGWSDGGNIGLILAYSRPDLVQRLVVSGANQDADGLGVLKYFTHLPAAMLLATALPNVAAWLKIHRRVSPDRGADLHRSFEKMQRMWVDYAIPTSSLASISAPTLVMAGDRDMIPVAHTVKIWSAIPGAQLCIAPGADHFWLQEKPDLANQIVLDFLLAGKA